VIAPGIGLMGQDQWRDAEKLGQAVLIVALFSDQLL
jgi:hypothetical protein